MDLYGRVLEEYSDKGSTDILWLNNSYGEREEMPVDVFFRDAEEMPELEHTALKRCRGSILDVGAGAGSHCLELQALGLTVSALEVSAGACAVMKRRGVKTIINQDIFSYNEARFDTLLLLMNGIGLSGTLEGLRSFLSHCKQLLNKGGILLFDSSDIAYLYEDGLEKPERYYGEIRYQYEYKGNKGPWFSWLYIDPHMLLSIAAQEGWQCQIIYEDDQDQYLAELRCS